jgi:hypothetical protein
MGSRSSSHTLIIPFVRKEDGELLDYDRIENIFEQIQREERTPKSANKCCNK